MAYDVSVRLHGLRTDWNSMRAQPGGGHQMQVTVTFGISGGPIAPELQMPLTFLWAPNDEDGAIREARHQLNLLAERLGAKTQPWRRELA